MALLSFLEQEILAVVNERRFLVWPVQWFRRRGKYLFTRQRNAITDIAAD
jgi:hypothetical protein